MFNISHTLVIFHARLYNHISFDIMPMHVFSIFTIDRDVKEMLYTVTAVIISVLILATNGKNIS